MTLSLWIYFNSVNMHTYTEVIFKIFHNQFSTN